MPAEAADVATPPRLAVLGGTGTLGFGLAMRLCTAGYDVTIGSRDAARAAAVAERLRLRNARGAANPDAAAAAEVVVLAVPFEGHEALVQALAPGLSGKLVVDATVPMSPDRRFAPPPAGSAAQQTQALVPDARVVAAFHTVSGRLLADIRAPLDQDVLVCGDDPDARRRVIDLAGRIGLRGVDAGDLSAAATIEALAVLLVNLNVRYRRRHLGIKIAHLPDDARPR